MIRTEALYLWLLARAEHLALISPLCQALGVCFLIAIPSNICCQRISGSVQQLRQIPLLPFQSPTSLHWLHILSRLSGCPLLLRRALLAPSEDPNRFPWHSAEQANLWPALTFHAGRSTSLPHSAHTPIAYFGFLFGLDLPAYVQAFEQKRTEAAFRSNSDPQFSQLCKRFLRVIARRHSLPQVACRLTGFPQFKHSLNHPSPYLLPPLPSRLPTKSRTS